MAHSLPSPELAETREIVISINRYDDIFSSFDMRPYTKRAFSVDFLDELKRASYEKHPGGIELTFHMPESERHESHELVIRERLSTYFKRHYQMVLKERNKVIARGVFMLMLGAVCTIIATFVMYDDPSQDVLRSFLVVFLEPASWFLLWEGMNQIVFGSHELDGERFFYKKMSDPRGHVHFRTYPATQN